MNSQVYLAHSANDDGRGVVEPLPLHLRLVGQRAGRYATALGVAPEATIAGLLHDVGKYSQRFLARLAGKEHGLDHWTAGAVIALEHYGADGHAIAAAILGHHVGLGSIGPRFGDDVADRFAKPERTLTEADTGLLLDRLAADQILLPPAVSALFNRKSPKVGAMLDVRMLFSALVDADFIETEAHFEGDATTPRRYRADGKVLDAARSLELVRYRVEHLTKETHAAVELRGVRSDLFQACLTAAARNPGLFTLTAPTGAGKTLAMLAFALAHAKEHRLRRIVVVLPYLNIIEQTAGEYRKLFAPFFGEEYVLEDHSLANRLAGRGEASDGSEEAAARLLAENWDAPVIITTSVQCLESLFANRPAACRKLHRLADSVVIFDEVQTLPLELAIPTLAALSRLTERFGASVVFSTATQPAFDHLDEAVRKHCTRGWSPTEIAPPTLDLFRRSRRVHVVWRHEHPISWQALAVELSSPQNRRVLCIVNLKRHARELAKLVEPQVERGALFHLSTNMCPAHRRTVLEEVRARLNPKSPQPCVLIATQCIEAGVDISFPRLYRALAPLDSIAQAAGRCNREGVDPIADSVAVFTPKDDQQGPPGAYQEATIATRAFLSTVREENGSGGMPAVLDEPELLNRYFRFLYSWRAADAMSQLFADAIRTCDFEEIAWQYKLIKRSTINVVVPYDQAGFAHLVSEYERLGRLTRRWVHEARDHTIGLFRPRGDQAEVAWTCLRPLAVRRDQPADVTTADWFILLESSEGLLYDDKAFGFNGLTGQWIA